MCFNSFLKRYLSASILIQIYITFLIFEYQKQNTHESRIQKAIYQ